MAMLFKKLQSIPTGSETDLHVPDAMTKEVNKAVENILED